MVPPLLAVQKTSKNDDFVKGTPFVEFAIFDVFEQQTKGGPVPFTKSQILKK